MSKSTQENAKRVIGSIAVSKDWLHVSQEQFKEHIGKDPEVAAKLSAAGKSLDEAVNIIKSKLEGRTENSDKIDLAEGYKYGDWNG